MRVSADKNPEYDTDPGNDTEDQVFLLSIPEVEKYFKTDDERRCKQTEYARLMGASIYEGYCCWWLRSPGILGEWVTDVQEDGRFDYHGGNSLSNSDFAVRPALWVDLN